MKTFKLLSLFAFIAMMSITACKNGAADETRESLATPNTTDVTQTTTPTINNNTKDANATPTPVGPTTTIEFEESTFDYGEVPEGDKVVHIYKFKNTGNEPLIISNAKGSCGCTVPDWPKEPIAVGDEGEIRVEFDSKGKGSVEGKPQSKRVTITANTDPINTYLTIKGKVLKTEAPTG